jgi:O-acetylhomoserine/O-acetylserine sulfhydrylase-like pyridoxal-dependent enzyme
MDLLVERLATPLQIEQYLTLAFEEAYSIGQKPVTAEVIENVLAQGLDDLEPRLTRHGYNAKVLAELLNVRPAEVRSFLHGQLPPGRTQDLRDQMLRVGIPL